MSGEKVASNNERMCGECWINSEDGSTTCQQPELHKAELSMPSNVSTKSTGAQLSLLGED